MGDTDFKVAGTRDSITALQVRLKNERNFSFLKILYRLILKIWKDYH
jgi:hypothetical protein